MARTPSKREGYNPADYCQCGNSKASGRHGPDCPKRTTPWVPPADPDEAPLPKSVAGPAPGSVVPVVPEVMPAEQQTQPEPGGQAEIHVRISGKFKGRVNIDVTE
jgi:hypothetical protein